VDIEEFKEATFEEAKDFVSSKGLKSLKKDDDDFFCDILLSGCPDLIEKVGLLISAGVDVNAPTDGILNGFTPLSIVVKKAKKPVELIDLLISNGSDIEAKSQIGLTPLHCAIIIQNLELVKYLISKGANPNAVDEDGASCLMLALLSNDDSQSRRLYWPFHDIAGGAKKQVCIEILNELVRSGGKLDYQGGWRNNSVLDAAITTGKIALVDWLFQHGIKPTDTISSSSSKTLLMSACSNGDLAIASHLLQVGANVDAVDQDGETALFLTSDPKIAKVLLDAGANLIHQNKNGRSLFQRSYFRKEMFLKFGKDFVRQGGDIHGTDANGRNILHHLADSHNGLAAIGLALRLGCDVNLQDRNGTTPLMLAHAEYWQVLLAAGARINDVDTKGNHALHIHLSRELITHGADINCANKQGQTPLMLAAKKDDIRLVKALLKAGARADTKDKKGMVATDYAEAKALAALVELGAPLNPESTSALATAIVGKNASLAIKLLKAGLKARLSEWEVKGNLGLLENIAQEDLTLFRGGVLGKDEKAEKLIAKIVAARDRSLDTAKARPICGDEDLPRVLRPGEWPRKLEAPTQHITVTMPLTDGRTPLFNPPAGFEQRMRHLHDQILADISGWEKWNKRPKYNCEKDLLRMREKCLSLEQLDSKAVYLKNYMYKNPFGIENLIICSDDKILQFWNDCSEIFHFINTDKVKITSKSKFDLLFYRLGSDAFQGVCRNRDLPIHCLSYFDSIELVTVMARSIGRPPAQRWFTRFPETGVKGLLASAFGEFDDDRSDTQQALRWLSARGFREKIEQSAKRFGTEAQAAAVTFLDRSDEADFLPRKLAKLPTYFVASAHPAPILKEGGKALPAHAVETLCRMMLVSSCNLQTPALTKVIEACDPQSLADFALSAYDGWCKNGSKKEGIGFLHALGYVGDARAAALLIKNYRNAPFHPATAAAIEVLGALGTNTAISGLLTIMRSSRYEKAQAYAQEILEDISDTRGLTPVMFEDLAVPDLGLDSNSQISLDFGPRLFQVTLDSKLDAVLKDEGGNVLTALPKALKSDNAQKANAATVQWKEFKAALKVQASDQKKRFEQAMLTRREWDGATFKEVVANHPLLSKMVRSLVWATVAGEVPGTAFRVDADGRYVTADGAGFILADDARVILPHPVHLGGTVEIWLQIFAENKLTQPFLQLARKWFVESPETENLISDRDGTKVPLGALRGLKAKGWKFEEGGAGMVWSVYKHFEGARASINVEPGWSLSGFDYEDFGGDQTVKFSVRGSDPIAYSELIRDFLSLPVATGEEP
jgi:ankyrin repeat protein